MDNQIQAVKAEEAAAESTVVYLAGRGISVNCEIPSTVTRLPVLFVDFEERGAGKNITYKGYQLDVTGSDKTVPVSANAGKAKGQICGASSAVLEIALLHPEISDIQEVELVYWIDRSGYELPGEDTAFPAWRVRTNMASYYIEALL